MKSCMGIQIKFAFFKGLLNSTNKVRFFNVHVICKSFNLKCSRLIFEEEKLHIKVVTFRNWQSFSYNFSMTFFEWPTIEFGNFSSCWICIFNIIDSRNSNLFLNLFKLFPNLVTKGWYSFPFIKYKFAFFFYDDLFFNCCCSCTPVLVIVIMRNAHVKNFIRWKIIYAFKFVNIM